MPKSKFFRVAVEGATTDGRTIDRGLIEQMAASFDPQKYGARVWMEHIRSTVADSPFQAYGDVTALKAEEITLDGKKKLALFAQIEPLPALVAMNKARQKIYTSVEINPKFGDSGQAYLMGLGVTDSPASLGTEMLTFSAQHPEANPLAHRKQAPGNLFSELVELDLQMEPDESPSVIALAMQGLKDKVAKFTGKAKAQDGQIGELIEVMSEVATATGDLAAQFSASEATRTTDSQALAVLHGQFKTLQAKYDAIDTTDANKHSQRPAATGNDASRAVTDC